MSWPEAVVYSVLAIAGIGFLTAVFVTALRNPPPPPRPLVAPPPMWTVRTPIKQEDE